MVLMNLRREYPEQPIIAVAALILNENGDLLLVRRNSEPGKGLWSIPGGVVELGESLDQALKREVKEETGLDIKSLKLLDVFEVVEKDYSGKIRYHYIILDYIVEKCGGLLKPATDVSDAKWVSIEKINSYNITRSLKKLIDKHKQRIYKL